MLLNYKMQLIKAARLRHSLQITKLNRGPRSNETFVSRTGRESKETKYKKKRWARHLIEVLSRLSKNSHANTEKKPH